MPPETMAGLPSPLVTNFAILVAAVWVMMKIVEMIKALREPLVPSHVNPDTDSRIQVLRSTTADVLGAALNSSVLPILNRQTEILQGIQTENGRHHEAMTRLGFEVAEMRAQQQRTHDGVHRLTASVQDGMNKVAGSVHDVLGALPKRSGDR